MEGTSPHVFARHVVCVVQKVCPIDVCVKKKKKKKPEMYLINLEGRVVEGAARDCVYPSKLFRGLLSSFFLLSPHLAPSVCVCVHPV